MEVKAKIEGKNLVITVPLYDKPTPSGSGKSLVVGGTRGNIKTELEVNGQPVFVGVTAYIKR